MLVTGRIKPINTDDCKMAMMILAPLFAVIKRVEYELVNCLKSIILKYTKDEKKNTIYENEAPVL